MRPAPGGRARRSDLASDIGGAGLRQIAGEFHADDALLCRP